MITTVTRGHRPIVVVTATLEDHLSQKLQRFIARCHETAILSLLTAVMPDSGAPRKWPVLSQKMLQTGGAVAERRVPQS